jgi:hypothetical protein
MKKFNNILRARNLLIQSSDLKIVPAKRKRISLDKDMISRLQQSILKGELNTYNDLVDKADHSPGAKDKHYMRTSRLRKKVLDEMALMNYSDSMRTDYNRSRYEVQRSLMLAHVLKIKGISNEAIELWEKTLRKARRYSLTTEAYICTQHLSYEYAFRRKYEKHYNIVRVSRMLLKAMEAEYTASFHYHRLIHIMKGKWYINPSYRRLTSATSSLVEKLAIKYRTHDLYSMHYRTRIYDHYAAHDYTALLNTCSKYHSYLKNHKHLQQDSRWAEIAIHRMNGFISLGNYSTGIRMANENRKYMRPENPNWFSYLENYFQLLMNAGEYMKAKQLYGEVVRSTHKKNMTPQQVDVWKVFLAYVQLALHSSGMISRFKPRQHFSVLTTCKSDKAGLNFLIEAGMIMYMLIQANRSDIDKHGERFKKYVKRHIVKKLMPRHYLFSRMLLVFIRLQHRSPEYITKSVQKYHDALKTTSSLPHDFEANELIRFEHLSEMLLRMISVRQLMQAA